MWGTLIGGLLTIGLSVAAVPPVWAHAAIAVGGSMNEVAKKGIAVGFAYNYETQDAADADALQKCKNEPNAPAETKAKCELVGDYSHKWLAIALDPEAGTPGFGWSIATDQTSAEHRALDQCKATSPDDRKPYCKVTNVRHDEKP